MIVDERLVTYINSLDTGNTEILDEIEREALETYVPIVRKEMQSFLKLILSIKRPARILEVGTAVGFSAILMAEYNPIPCEITTIENYEKRIPIAKQNFVRAGKEKQITLLEGDAEDILKESVSKIREIIAEKNPDLKDKEDVAQKVGIGAIIFNDLYNQRIKDVTFTWEKIHSFDGETGPYVQYTYARAASVLRKTGITEVGEIDPSLVTDETYVALLKEIERFPEVIKVAADRLEPSVISRF